MQALGVLLNTQAAMCGVPYLRNENLASNHQPQ